MRRIFIALIAGFLITATHIAYALTTHDDMGNTIVLNQLAQRIISLAPSITENLFAIGAGSRIVGTTSAADYPEAAKRIPIIGDYQNLNLEAIAAQRPDVVIAWHGGNSPAQIAALSRLNIPVYIHQVRTLADIPLALMRLAQLTGLERTAAPIIAQAYSQIPLLRDAPKPLLGAFYQIWSSPLMTLNQDNWATDALLRCGVRNIFADLPITAPTVNIETVLKSNPDLIITTSPNATPNTDLDMWRTWPHLSAVQHQGLLFVDTDAMSRATLRTLTATQRMCQDIQQIRPFF